MLLPKLKYLKINHFSEGWNNGDNNNCINILTEIFIFSSVRVNCSEGQQIKINNKKCELPAEDGCSPSSASVVVTPPGPTSYCNENIVRRSKSVVIHCNTRDTNRPRQTLQGKANPVICDTKHDTSDAEHDDCLSMKENLDDIKLEIERLITEREEFLKENSVLKFYKESSIIYYLSLLGRQYLVWLRYEYNK